MAAAASTTPAALPQAAGSDASPADAPSSQDCMTGDPFTQVLRSPDLMERLAAHPETRKHMADPGFHAQIDKLRKLANDPSYDARDFAKSAEVSSLIARAAYNDPRMMQVLMTLQGYGLTVEEKDMKKAEDFGDMPRREPVQLEQLQLVRDLKDPDEAKARGNEYFKKADFAAALAHYECGAGLIREMEECSAAALATLFSNAALCLLKLKWPDRAKKNASLAIAAVRQAGDETFDQSKLFYRRALACEQLRDFGQAVDDMGRALQQAKKSKLDLAEQHRLKAEVARLRKLRASDEETTERRKTQNANEKVAEVQRMQGTLLDGATKKASVPDSALATPAGDASYISEQDFTHWTRARIVEVVKGLKHACQSGATLETTSLDEERSKIQASITTKRGNRALYYEMDLHVKWTGKAAASLKPQDGDDELSGLIRVYNIAHDTKFELGGDENTSYIYQLGWDQRKTGPWAQDMQTEAAELFDLVAVKVDSVIRQLRAK